jgi:hypothetical protein
MFEIQDAAKAAFKASPELYPIINGKVRDEDEDTVDINLNLLAIDLFRNREENFTKVTIEGQTRMILTSLKSYVDEVREAFEYYVERMRDEAVEFLILLYTGEANEYKELQITFGNYVSDWIKNGGDGDELQDIAYNFVNYDDGQYLITNQDASKVV